MVEPRARERTYWAPILCQAVCSVQFSSVSQSFPTLCSPMNCSMPGLPVHHKLLEFTQTHVHQLGDAIQLSHPLSSPSPPALNPSQDQGLYKWISFSYQVAKVWSFSFNISPSNEHSGLVSFRMGWLDLLAVQGTLGTFTPQFKSINSLPNPNPSLWSNSHIHTWLLEKL